MRNEIKINTQIQLYAEDFIPYVIKMNHFLKRLSSFYSDELSLYCGEAKTEISTYSSSMLNQIVVLSQNYTCLSNNLSSIVEAFLQFDEESEKKIKQFISTIYIKSEMDTKV